MQTLLRHADCSSARSNRDAVVDQMKRSLQLMESVVTDSGAAAGPALSSAAAGPVNGGGAGTDSGISLSLLQTTAFTAIKEFEVGSLYKSLSLTGPPLLNGRCTSLLRAVVSEMTYTVSSGTLNSTIPYHTSHCCVSH